MTKQACHLEERLLKKPNIALKIHCLPIIVLLYFSPAVSRISEPN
jgi:hypothetical protein